MTASSLLVRIPGTPFSINDLRPDTRLATLAASLIESGHRAVILDFGTLETFERLYPSNLRAQAIHHVESLRSKHQDYGYDVETGPVGKFAQAKLLAERHEGVWEHVGEKIAARRDFDFVVVAVAHPKDLVAARIAASRIRALVPRTKVFAWGTAFVDNHDLVAKSVRYFDAVYLGSLGDGIAQLAEVLNETKKWKRIPDLAYADGVRFNLTAPTSAAFGPVPSPAFDEAVYASISEQTKLKVFDLDTTMLRGVRGLKKGENTRILKPVGTLVEEIRSLNTLYNAHAFHFSGCRQKSDHAIDLAREILSKKLRICYSRNSDISSTPPRSIATLSASGCRAVDFRIDSGSQRLLDRYYGHPFTVTEIERVLRRCSFSDLFAVTRYTYPTSEDDRHTLAETLRLIARTNPDSVIIELPSARASDGRRGLLFQEFRPFSKSAGRRAAAERQTAAEAVQELGVDLGISGRFALLAELAGHQGREAEFKAQMTYQMLTGDTFGIASSVERINDRATAAVESVFFKPFTPVHDAIAN